MFLIQVYVFSYNRPSFLNNCLSSIKRNIGDANVVIIDDRSTNPAVRSVIDSWTSKGAAEFIEPSATSYGLRGGLYNNMQLAYEHGLKNNVRLALFVQDDMQLVRTLTEGDLRRITRYFDVSGNSAQLQVTFFKSMYRSNLEERVFYDREGGSYLIGQPEGSLASYSDVGIFDLRRLHSVEWRFVEGEGANVNEAARRGLKMGHYPFPLMMYLPYPKTEYYRRKLISLRILEWWVGAGFFPYRDMSAPEVGALFGRDLSVLPFAEEFLLSAGIERPMPWVFGGAIIGMIQQGGFGGRLAGLAGRFERVRSRFSFRRR